MPTTTTPLDDCHHPLVRDLAWVLLAPDLIALPSCHRPTRQELGLADDTRLREWLADIEANPAPLESHIGDALVGRMGLYHERLWQFLLNAAPGTQLLAHNLRILRDRLTLGEFDLIYQKRDSDTTIHLEVAIKFYLGLPVGPRGDTDQARWIGPGGADSLANKREHLYQRQLRLSEQPEARDTLRRLVHGDAGVSEEALRITRRLAMPGVLFYPLHGAFPAPHEATRDHLKGRWLHWSDWPRLRDAIAPGTQGRWLRKPHWLALPRKEWLSPLRDIEAQLAEHFTTPASPIQLALHHPTQGWQRLFVVADDWPRQVPLPPAGE
ncbi:DUF1853 family protein [Halomonas urumqiensis]|uniref:DUF1853 domain-containing protein n=1 Tax=Halomonas urumqiensis TaxID=1684789 RepID=A0A2N7ULT0_9GAMM|nr:DUF1853 family protein [Halomonas urumqiensis]PMR81391.1 DUF1853 domain-containing protein [Halomonas urumqiensis]PTB01191.1 DUF1853 domain-containing protein [Halomonas urumqiensis]GHE22764.1 hypothetical protein GCM10017767_32850 [Halomonas urumqiensis]